MDQGSRTAGNTWVHVAARPRSCRAGERMRPREGRGTANNGNVLVGNSGGKLGVRGWLTALDLRTARSCGARIRPGHANMAFNVVAEPMGKFKMWIQHQDGHADVRSAEPVVPNLCGVREHRCGKPGRQKPGRQKAYSCVAATSEVSSCQR